MNGQLDEWTTTRRNPFQFGPCVTRAEYDPFTKVTTYRLDCSWKF